MNESAKKTFKMKFAKLTMMLNAILLLAALSVLAFFGLIPIYSIQIAAICAILCIILIVLFRKHYLADKAWLNEQDD
ncbi:hypothetical protein F1737_08330 [Methanoplanus sp. FWC-SCC4]|uniref:Uncharacterized protein n=1 Tax=Methanochimaera problematica TaxID=2609417 RepID=A0AA97I4N7_9EURY|nr:hypothetical protein [Methanoplanus sp. FWC-SCC4]WOF16694.1 hypothetical protein F1737_08330 [Methanoplanus sp. FWC-SCC4]